MAKIAKYRVDDIASKMLASKAKRNKQWGQDIATEIAQAYLSQVKELDVNMLAVFEYYPKSFNLLRSTSIQIDETKEGNKNFYYVRLLVPFISDEFTDTFMSKDPKRARSIRVKIDKLRKANENYRQLRAKIICTVEELGTPSKLKKEFPEAYKVYIGSDTDAPKGTDLGTDIEGIRKGLK